MNSDRKNRKQNKSSLSTDGVDNDQSRVFGEGVMIEVIAEIDDMYIVDIFGWQRWFGKKI